MGGHSDCVQETCKVALWVPEVTLGPEKHEERPPRNTRNSVSDGSVPLSGREWGLAVHGELGMAVIRMSF